MANTWIFGVEGSLSSSAQPWRQPRGKSMVSLVNSLTNATRIGWHVWEIDSTFPLGYFQGG